MTIIDHCGCKRTKVAEGTPMEGWRSSYCNFHNPYKNIAPRRIE